MKYVVVYICDALPDQVTTDHLDIQTATDLSASLTAEAILEGSNLKQESYIIQPVITTEPNK